MCRLQCGSGRVSLITPWVLLLFAARWFGLEANACRRPQSAYIPHQDSALRKPRG
jgi:hypothetical protein